MFSVIRISDDHTKLDEQVEELYGYLQKLNSPMQKEGVKLGLLGSNRFVIEKNDSGEVTGVCILAGGYCWVDNKVTSTLLYCNVVNREEAIKFLREMSRVLGVTSFYYSKEDRKECQEKNVFESTVIEEVLN